MIRGWDVIEAKAKAADVTIGDSVTADVLDQLGLPMVVACAGCQMTMGLPSAHVDPQGFTYCAECAEQKETADVGP